MSDLQFDQLSRDQMTAALLQKMIRRGGDWLQVLDFPVWRWRHKGEGWRFGEQKPTDDPDRPWQKVQPLFTINQIRLAFRVGALYGHEGTIEDIKAGDIEYASWLDELRDEREDVCLKPANAFTKNHDYDFSNPPPGYVCVCATCGHQSSIPF